MVIPVLTTILLLASPDSADGQKAVSQMKTLLADFDVPGPYIFKSFQANGLSGGKSFCVVKVLDGERVMCTAETQPGTGQIGLIYRGKYSGPTQVRFAKVYEKKVLGKPLRDTHLKSSISKWSKKILGSTPAALERCEVSSDGVVTADFTLLSNGLPSINQSCGFTIKLNATDGRFVSFNGLLNPPKADSRAIKLKDTSLVCQHFQSRYRTDIFPFERNQEVSEDSLQGVPSPVAKPSPKGGSVGGYVSAPRVTKTTLGFYPLPGGANSIWVWRIDYLTNPTNSKGAYKPIAKYVLIDAVSGHLIQAPIHESLQ